MGNKRFFHFKKEIQKAATLELTIPGEPLIYSVRHTVAKRKHGLTHFRNKRLRLYIKCHFRSYWNSKTPLVILVKFYVTPLSELQPAQVTKANLKAEKTPAPVSWELCDYLLSFLEMLHKVLYQS